MQSIWEFFKLSWWTQWAQLLVLGGVIVAVLVVSFIVEKVKHHG